MTPLSVLELAPESMKQSKEFSDVIIRDVRNGVVTSKKVRSLLFGFAKAFEEIEITMIIEKL